MILSINYEMKINSKVVRKFCYKNEYIYNVVKFLMRKWLE